MASNLLPIPTDGESAQRRLSAIDVFSGAGGFARGLERVGFDIAGIVEQDADSLETIGANRGHWPQYSSPIQTLSGRRFVGIDLLSATIPSALYSEAGAHASQGKHGDFPDLLRLVREARPSAVVFLSVRGLATSRFAPVVQAITQELAELGYHVDRKLVVGSQHGLLQPRSRLAIVALSPHTFTRFDWPIPDPSSASVGSEIGDLMSAHGWQGAERWAALASGLAPTIVGGSSLHGGADLGPTRAKQAWLRLGVDPRGIADTAPEHSAPINFFPRLTNRMVARLQSFDDEWAFRGKKTSVYRQIANATSPIVASALGASFAKALRTGLAPLGQPTRTMDDRP